MVVGAGRYLREVRDHQHLPRLRHLGQRRGNLRSRLPATAEVDVLYGDDRVREIARMLGDPDDPALLLHSRELLGQSGTAVV